MTAPPSQAALAFALGLLLLTWTACSPASPPEEPFVRLMNTGKNYYEQNQAQKAIPLFQQAVGLAPNRPEAHLNLANACLAAGQADNALRHARAALDYDRNLAAAYYVAGCAALRLRQPAEALQMLQMAHDLDATVPAVAFQLGRAHQESSHWEDAAAAFREAITLDPRHPVAYYSLSQVLMRNGQADDAAQALAQHQRIRTQADASPALPETYERCQHTLARAPLAILKPDPKGIPIRFVDATRDAFGPDSTRYHAPLAILDFNRDDRNSVVAAEGTNGFRLLVNLGGSFSPLEPVWAAHPAGGFRRLLVGDLNNDRFEDVLALGDTASHLYRLATNGVARDVTAAAGLKGLVATDAALIDLDFTGKLDLLATLPDDQGLRVLRNLGNMYFKDITATSGVPSSFVGSRQIRIDDWNNDDLMDVVVARTGQSPLYLQKQRGGPLVPTPLPIPTLTGPVLALGELNGDRRADLIVGAPDHLDVLLGGIDGTRRIAPALPGLSRILLADYDNDGWLDLLALGDGCRLWRNLGDGRFADMTRRVGLDTLPPAPIDDAAIADLDRDGDSDLLFALRGQGLHYRRNDGGNAHQQLKLRLIGNRSNASGLGIRLEITAGSFRAHRTVQSLPVEIGVGNRPHLDGLTARWFDLAFNQIDLEPDPKAALPVFEPVLPTGSCPYLYAWNGHGFRFVSDILGSAPMGLRKSDTVFVEADPHEFLSLGTDLEFPPRDGHYELRITEELREVLYLDQIELVAVDHPPGTEVQTTDKMRPGRPFPRGELWTLENPRLLLQATRLDGRDVTEALRTVDGVKVSPERLRIPQLRGLAETHGLVLDFGPLPTDRPWVLVLNGWLRFGGGMANVAASHNPELPFPFPRLDVETADGRWREVDAVVGVPSGKTKTILVDLAGRLPESTTRLRLTTAYEIHWDRAALLERRTAGDTRITRIGPETADLHWRGFSQFADLPWTEPLTPVYDRVYGQPHWTITPTGWCTRYGPVNPLVAAEDDALVLLNGGDELTARFATDQLPPTPPGHHRTFFSYTVGWDKDADFHVELGWKVEPLPWHGMNDLAYGREQRPPLPTDPLMQRFTTRWVGPFTFPRTTPQNSPTTPLPNLPPP